MTITRLALPNEGVAVMVTLAAVSGGSAAPESVGPTKMTAIASASRIRVIRISYHRIVTSHRDASSV